MEKEISTTGPTDFEEILVLTRQIGLCQWKSNSVPKTSRSLNTFRHHAARISASISIFYSVVHPSDFPFSTRVRFNANISILICIYNILICLY